MSDVRTPAWRDVLVEQFRVLGLSMRAELVVLAVLMLALTIVSDPMQSPNGGQWFFFVKDCDGNLIEIMDLGKLYYVLKWLGPLGGWLARHGYVQDYRQYYLPKK